MSARNHWTALRQRRISRRTMLGASAKAGVGVAGLALVGCGDDDEPDAGAVAAERAAAAAEEAAAAAIAAGEASAADTAAAAEAADAAGEASAVAAEAADAAGDASAAAGEASATAQDTAEAAAETAAAAVAAAQEAADAAREAAESAAMAAEEDEPAPATGPKYGGTLSMLAIDGGIFDPAIAIHGGTDNSIFPIYDFLNWQDDGLQVTAGMAELPEVVDELNIIYNIKPNVHWQDKPPLNGRQFVAEDAAFGLARFGQDNPEFIFKDRYSLVDEFEVLDDLTMRIRASEPFAPLLTAVGEASAFMISRDAVDAFGDEGISNNPDALVGTGSMMFVSREEGVDTRYERNPNYFREGQPYIDSYHLIWVADAALRIAQYVAGELDFLDLKGFGMPFEVEAVIAEVGEENVVSVPNPASFGINTHIHTKVEPFTDPRVRLALHLAADREQLKLASLGIGLIGGPIAHVIEPYGKSEDELRQLPGYRSGSQREEDLAAARQLIDASGASSGPPMKAWNGLHTVDLAQIMQRNWADIGFEIGIIEQNVVDVLGDRANHDFSIISVGQQGAADPDLLYNDLHTNGGQNHGEFSDPEIDEMLVKGRTTFGVDNRKAIYDEIQTKLLEEHAPRIWYEWMQPVIAHRPWLKGFRPTPAITASNIVMNECWLDGKPS